MVNIVKIQGKMKEIYENEFNLKDDDAAYSENHLGIEVPNQYVATLEINNSFIKYEDNFICNPEDRNVNDKIIKRKNYRELLIVLESPNESELKDIDKNQIGPALGKTGEVISNNLLYHLGAYLNFNFIKPDYLIFHNLNDYFNGKYKVILCNVIKFKTIFREKDNGKTQKHFAKLFNEQIFKDDFKNNLKLFNPFLIINACTSEKNDEVSMIIREIHKNSILLKAIHPSSGNTWGPFEMVI